MQGDPMGGLISAIVWMVLFVGIFYFLILRPQQQQRKKHEEFLKNLKKGEKVITTGGIIGEIKNIEEKTVSLKVCEGCIIKVLKPSIASYYQEEATSQEEKG
ncbi:preprotein translocase subunit YajC [Sulfurihydrogenibium yellowstonense]|jgi:preprotein translocase, YajC subunit|uniref:Sec translocon accessory complex subunit YajC n=1 Tax=Sulfurihydrogenibium yellowstonense SS-5 TaxID=432331 RepID=C4FIL9_9AQUI|nr:preprotein translocase subunit YajC [Sulfurihydrogenibium yellowstonense]EEP61077.1 preprotein translocase, YajC subunit [Sulfurihydrogenibium yellowstonense SS-5]